MVYSNLIDVTRRISFYVFLKRSKNFKNYQYRFICKQYLIQYSSIYPKKRGIVSENGTSYPIYLITGFKKKNGQVNDDSFLFYREYIVTITFVLNFLLTVEKRVNDLYSRNHRPFWLWIVKTSSFIRK